MSASPITSRWPTCTPSKVPTAIARGGPGAASVYSLRRIATKRSGRRAETWPPARRAHSPCAPGSPVAPVHSMISCASFPRSGVAGARRRGRRVRRDGGPACADPRHPAVGGPRTVFSVELPGAAANRRRRLAAALYQLSASLSAGGGQPRLPDQRRDLVPAAAGRARGRATRPAVPARRPAGPRRPLVRRHLARPDRGARRPGLPARAACPAFVALLGTIGRFSFVVRSQRRRRPRRTARRRASAACSAPSRAPRGRSGPARRRRSR